MLELCESRYDVLLEPALKIPINMLLARSVISGHVDGRIFVDSYEHPQTFYIVHQCGVAFLCGYSSSETFNRGLFDYLAGKLSVRSEDERIQVFPRDWDTVMERLVNEGRAITNGRLNFKFDAATFCEKYRHAGKSRYEVVATPTDMLFKINGTITPRKYWKTLGQCAAAGKAFSVMIDGKPVSTACTTARHDNKLEIGIETVTEYQGQGLAYLACAKLIEYCLDNNIEPVWSCRSNNVGSINLSKKLGFSESLRMPYYHIPK